MGAFILIAFVLSALSASLYEDVYAADAYNPCPAEGCKNITIYIGPRFGSKTLRVPSYPKTNGPSDEEAKKVNVSRVFDVNGFFEKTLGVADKNAPVRTGVPSSYYTPDVPRGTGNPDRRHRPILDDDSVVVDYADAAGEPRQRNGAMRQSNSNPSDQWTGPALNWTGLDLGGAEVKDFLSRMSEEDSKRVNRLYLGSNRIQYLQPLTFPRALETSLQELWLDHNPLMDLTSYTCFEISRLANLKLLNLSSTGLSSLEPPYFLFLRVLDLSHNQISYLSPSISTRLYSLQVLDLSHNLLHGIYDPDFSGLYNLQILDLSSNMISYLSPDSMKKMGSLNTLYLNNNSLTSLSHVSLPLGVRVSLSQNVLECSCPLLALYQQNTPTINEKYNLSCFENGQWRRLRDLRESDLHIDCERSFLGMRVRAEKMEAVTQWLRHPRQHLFSAWTLAGCVLLLVVLVLVVVQVHRVRAKRALRKVPYNILDDTNVQQA